MTGIGVLADKHTATSFKLAGLRDVFPVNDPTQARQTFLEILEKNELRILLVSEQLLSKIQSYPITPEQQSLLIIPIPTIQGRAPPKVDFMAELIKRKTGIEVKL